MIETSTTNAARTVNRHFVIVGPGALGSVVGAHLARSGVAVVLLGRATPHMEAIRDTGLTLTAIDGKVTRLDLNATDDPSVVSNADIIVVLVKTTDTEAAMRAIAPHIHPRQVLVTMQNGLGGVARIRDLLGNGPRILPAVTWQAATRLAPGRVRHAGIGPTMIGYLGSQDRATAEDLAAVFSVAGLPASVAPDIEQLIWQKAAVNAAINGLTALGEFENGRVVDDPELLRVAEALAEEAAGVARASGIKLEAMRETVIATARASAHNRSSMLQDLDAGRHTEVEAIHGEILRAAHALGVAVPTLATVTALIRAKERAKPENAQVDEHRGE